MLYYLQHQSQHKSRLSLRRQTTRKGSRSNHQTTRVRQSSPPLECLNSSINPSLAYRAYHRHERPRYRYNETSYTSAYRHQKEIKRSQELHRQLGKVLTITKNRLIHTYRTKTQPAHRQPSPQTVRQRVLANFNTNFDIPVIKTVRQHNAPSEVIKRISRTTRIGTDGSQVNERINDRAEDISPWIYHV